MSRRITGVIICILAVMAFFLSTPSSLAADDSSYQIVRVKLSMGTPTTVPFYVDGNYSVEQNDTVLEHQAYTVSLSGGELYLKYGTTTIYHGTTIRLVQHTATEGTNNFIRLKNAEHGYCNYLGDLAFSIYDGYIQVINHIYIEDYLYGVVPYEMSNSWPIEALKSQAVAARTYVARYMGGSGTYDVVDTPTHQVYKGYNPTYTTAVAAVDGTSKTVLTYNSSFVETFYSASNGGITEIPQHVWSAGATLQPYHVIQLDPYDTANVYSSQEALIFPKTITSTKKITYQYSDSGGMVTGSSTASSNAERYLKIQCLSAVAAKGYIAGVSGDVTIVSFENFVPHTLEDQHDIKDYNGNNICTCYEKADVTMTVMAKRYSQSGSTGAVNGDVNGDGKIALDDYMLIRMHILGLRTLKDNELTAADVNENGEIALDDYMLIRMHLLGIKDLSAQTNPGELIEEPVTVTFTINLHEFDKTDGAYQAFSRSLRLFTVEETADSFTLYHRRYGHGIGLSQRGAQERANSTDTTVNTYDKILGFYYPNTTFRTLSIDAPTLTTVTPPASSANATVVGTSTLNVRSSPDSSSSSNIVGSLWGGARIEVTQALATADWHQINYGGTAAYVHKDYVQLDG